MEDKKVLQWAAKENRILISHDKDFISLVEKQKKKTAVVVVRLLKQSPEETKKALKKLLKYFKKDKLSGKLILLEENSLRIW